MFEPLDSFHAARILLLAGGLAVAWSSALGVVMLSLMQPWCPKALTGFSIKAIGSAHLDWIMLGLMLGLVAGIVQVFEAHVPWATVAAFVVGAWLNPLPYGFKAFGINAFVMGGPPLQRFGATLGLISSSCLLVGWASLLYHVFSA
ncbi:MAG: hypothetical protein KTR25_13990 [Myxococcales bacterium]|nr:hypothetical protein [Myxococcales bacterium]